MPRPRKSSPYIKQTKDSIEDAAELVGISRVEGEEILDSMFFHFKEKLHNDERMPRLRLPKIGYFGPNVGIVRRHIKTSIGLYRRGKIPKFICDYRIKKYWEVRQRLAWSDKKYKMHREWNSVPTDFKTQLKDKEMDDKINEYYKGRRIPKAEF